MEKGLFLLAEKIKILRGQSGMTQATLAKRLGLTRSSINSWEMGLSVPSTSVLVKLSKIFSVSIDYLLGSEHGAALKIDDLSPKEVAILAELIECFRKNK